MFAEHADAFTRYLQLIINRDEGYNAFEMAMLSQGVDGIIKPKLNLDSQGLTYFFDIGGLVKLEQILTNPSVDELFVLKLLLQVVELNETICGHMLALEQIYWSLDYVYCNQIDRKIHLIYLPLSSANLLCSMSYKEFIDVIISKHLCSSVVTSSVQIKSYLNDPYFCQKGFKNLIVSLKKALETVITNDEANLGLTYSSVTDKAESVNKGNATRKSNVQKRWIVNVILVLVCVLIWFMLPLVTGDILEARWSVVLLGLGILLFRHRGDNQKIDMPAIQAIQAKSESIITTLKTTDEALFSTIKATNELDVYETTRLIPLETMGILKDAEGTFAYRVHQKRTIIGRHHELSDLVIASPAVGRKHAIITIDGYSVHIEDCNSKNGTRINGKRLEVGEVHTIKCGDLIELADFKLVYTTTV